MSDLKTSSPKWRDLLSSGIRYTLFGFALLWIVLIWLERIEEQEARSDPEPVAPPPMAVSATTIGRGPVVNWVVGEGFAEAVRKRWLSFEESGKVIFIADDGQGAPLREGSPILGPERSETEGGGGSERGQLLARIDGRDRAADVERGEEALAEASALVEAERAALSQAGNALDEAARHLQRIRALYGDRLVAKSALEEARTGQRHAADAVTAAEARLRAARANRAAALTGLGQAHRGHEKTALYAPFDGVVARMNIRVGHYFDPASVDFSDRAKLDESAPIVVLDPTEIEVTLHLPEFDGRAVRVGQPVGILSGAIDGLGSEALAELPESERMLEGEVFSVSPQLDLARRALRVRVRFRQQAPRILDGMYVTCWIATEEREHVVRVPLGALLFRDDEPYLYVVAEEAEGARAERRPLVLGLIDDEYAEVRSGLAAGEQVILKGRRKIGDRQPVRVVD